MAFIRVVFEGKGPSGLPEDRILNVFHFATTSGNPPATDAQACRDLVGEFFGISSTTLAIGEYLSPWVQRAATITSYDLDTPKPRVPTTDPFTLPTSFSGDGLPEEVAVCLSFRGAIPPGASGRRRGRVFIGPLSHAALQGGTPTTPARPTSGFVTDLVGAASRLLSNTRTSNLGWAIRSTRPIENFVLIDAGWVDNAFDTQRRRGPKSTARTVWT